MKVVVVSAPSGVSLTAATDKIVQYLTSPPDEPGQHKSVAIEDVESELCGLYRADYPAADVPPVAPMQYILFKLPRDAVTRHYWPEAAKSALRKLLKSPAEVKILRCHLTYYRDATKEFYDAGDVSKALTETTTELQGVQISSVLTLVDDIFDVFHRLSVEGQVFPLQDSIRAEYRRRQLDGRGIASGMDQQYILAFEQVVTVLHRLLEWRTREMSAGDMLASRCEAEHFVLGIKHATETAANLVRLGNGNTSLLPVYLSHPISRPRRQQKTHARKEWGKFVNELQTFAEVAGGVDVDGKRAILFMPTAIDEFRFADRTNPAFPSLERRWPLIGHRHGLLYDTPDGQDYEDFESKNLLEELFNPVGATYRTDTEELSRVANSHLEVPGKLSEDAKDAVDALVGGLLQQIRIQLSIRDHALVRQCGRLLLYRPLYEEGKLSGGVEAELQNWSGLLQIGKDFKARGRPVKWRCGPAVFVHDSHDGDKIEALNLRRLQDDLASRLRAALPQEKVLLFDLASLSGPVVTWPSQALQEDDALLGGAKVSPAERRALRTLFRKALEDAQKAVFDRTYLGGEPLEGKHYFVYERLAEITHVRFEDIARRDVLRALLASV